MARLCDSFLLLLMVGCARNPGPESTSIEPPCIPLPGAGPGWTRDTIPALGVSVLVPPSMAVDSEGAGYYLLDSLRTDSPFHATLAFELLTLLPGSDTSSNDVTFIDGVPISPGARGSHGPSVERRCTLRLAEHLGLLELAQTHGWGDSYNFILRLPIARTKSLLIRGSAGTRAFRDSLLASVGTLRFTKAI